jgi:amino acid adenylation domain-containing protein
VISGELHQEENYWLKKFSGELLRSNFPYDRKKSQNIRRMESVEFKFTDDIAVKLMKLMNKSDVRLHMVLTAALVVLMSKYTGNQDVVIGTPVLKQDIEANFINTVLALRCQIDEDHMTFKELLLQVRQTMVEANENQNYPIDQLPIQLGIPLSQNEDFPLFDIVILLENIQDKSYIQHINTNMIFSFLRTGEAVAGVLEYNSFLYEEATIDKIIFNFIHLVEEVLCDSTLEIPVILMLAGEERKQLLFDFNNTASGYPKDKTIHELFEDQVEKTPGNTAIVDSDGIRFISYKELNEKANQLAHLLISSGLKVDEIVGVLLERSIDMVIAMLGILKAGGAYLPIDTYYPENRIRYMLADSNANMLIGKREIIRNIADEKIIDPADEALRQCGTHNPGRISRSESLLYVIYTSGSTGKPKGVLVAHKGFVNLVQFHKQLFGQDHRSHMSQVANPSFDAMAFEVWPCLVYGAALYIAGNEVRVDAARLIEWFINNEIAISYQPTVMALQFLKAEWPKENISLESLIAAGDSLTLRPAPGHPFQLYNLYGPTEDTVWTTWTRVQDSTASSNMPDIGKPIANHRIYIVGSNLEPQPIGVPGEICIGGDGLAWGYLNQPQLAHERFVMNPFVPGKRMYRTGDQGRWLPDGDIDILGRMDQQVKIRGFRIELEGIENQLQKHRKIKDAVVIAREPGKGEKYLCAYVVSDEKLNVSEIKEYLLMNLPSYMVPPYFVELEQIPLTPNGKVDKNALAKMDIDILETVYVAPRNETEKKVADIWQNLLDLEKVSIKDNFFNIGGDSIKTISLINLLNKEFGTKLVLLDLYENETIEKVTHKINKACTVQHNPMREEVLNGIEELKNRALNDEPFFQSMGTIDDIYPLSDIQEGMVFYYLKDFTNSLYHNQMVFRLKYEEFDIETLKKTFALLVEKHPILRTGFAMYRFSEPLQIVFEKIPLNIEHYDISHLEEAKQEEFLESLLEEDRKKTFDISAAGPLWRLKTFALGNENIFFTWICHHAMIDGWSSASLMTEVNNTYLKLMEDPEFVLPKLKSTYKDFVVEQLAWKRNTDAIEFWRNELDGYKRFEFLGTIDLKEEKRDTSRKRRGYMLEISLMEKLNDVARKYNTYVKHLCFGAYVYMLNMLSYENDIVVGLITNNRPVCEDGDKILGCFLNSVPVRVKIPAGITWEDYIEITQKKILELKKYDAMPLFEIVKNIGEQGQNKNPIFDTFFNFVDFYVYNMIEQDTAKDSGAGDMNDKMSLDGFGETNTLFNFTVDVTQEGFRVYVAYSNSLIDDEWVDRLFDYFTCILDKFIYEPETLIEKDKIISPGEKRKILYHFNRSGTEFAADAACSMDKTIHELFEARVEKTPANFAVVFEDERLTYKELNEKANKLAGLLRAKGVASGSVVGVISEPSIDMVLGIIAILKAGGAFLPIDPEHPEERITFMLDDSRTKLVLTQRHLVGKVSIEGEIAAIGDGDSEDYDGANLENLSTPSDIVYVIYTSGTTGIPKGVQIKIENLVNYTYWFQTEGRLNDKDRTVLTSSFAFDLGYTSLFPSLLNGCQLHMVLKDTYLSDVNLLNYISENGITYLKMTPSLFTIIANSPDFSAEMCRTLRLVVLGGEQINLADVEKLYEICDDMQIMNHYGPTETTIGSIAKFVDFDKFEDYQRNPTIGKPIYNTKAYILDKHLGLMPVGVPGELCLSGSGLAKGYLNRDESTTEKFVANRFEQGERLYRTGDFARFLSDGDIEFLGRQDQQVKIRGYRIELGEIESQLSAYDEIKECVVMDYSDESGAKYLCAYIVAVEEIALEIAEFKTVLARRLPAYMIPQYIVQIDEIPLTANGKINRNALPIPEAGDTGKAYIAPRDQIEETLVAVWSELLNIQKDIIGIDNNFFELGGHSMKATLLAGKIYKAFGIRVPLVEIFKTSTVRELAEYIKNAEIERERFAAKSENMVLMRKESDSAKHLFFVHDGTGEVEIYIEFCNNFKNEFNCWGIRADRFENYAPKNLKFEDIAKTYIERIKTVQPQGPYCIAGWSLGGSLSFEIARQLEDMNEEIEFFAMIDTIAPSSDSSEKGSEFTVESELNWIRGCLPMNTELKEKLGNVTEINHIWLQLSDYLEHSDPDAEIIKRSIPENQLRAIPNFDQLPMRELIKYINTVRTFINARVLYTPTKRINTLVHFFAASQSKGVIKDNWNDYATSPVKYYEIPGGHFSIFSKPQVFEFAEIFERVLNSAIEAE